MDTAPVAPSTPSQAPAAPATAPADAKGTVGAPSTSPDKNAAPKTAQELYEVKVNGKTQKLSREELIAKAQLGMSADERFAMAAQLKRETEGVMGQFKDPDKMIKALMDPRLGLTKDEVRERFEKWYTEEFIEPEKMSPEQRKLRDAERELKAYRDKEQLALKEQQEKEFEALTVKEREALQTSITQALDKSGLPKTKFIVARMAFYMHKNLSNGWDAPMEIIIEQVKRERQEMLSDLINSSDAETLVSYFGEDFVNKIRKHDLKRLRERKMGGVDPEHAVREGRERKDDDAPKGPISYRDVNKNLRRLMQGK